MYSTPPSLSAGVCETNVYPQKCILIKCMEISLYQTSFIVALNSLRLLWVSWLLWLYYGCISWLLLMLSRIYGQDVAFFTTCLASKCRNKNTCFIFAIVVGFFLRVFAEKWRRVGLDIPCCLVIYLYIELTVYTSEFMHSFFYEALLCWRID